MILFAPATRAPGPNTARALRVHAFLLFSLAHCVLIAFFSLSLPIAFALAAPDPPSLERTDAERRFIEAHPEIRVVFDPGFPPFEFFSQGAFTGLAADLLHAALKDTGLTLVPTPARNWPELLDALKERRADMAAKIAYSPERAQYLLFTQPYVSIPVAIIVSANESRIRGLADLAGHRAAVVRGYDGQRQFQENGPAGVELVLVNSIQEGLRDVAFGEVEAFVGNQGVASYFIEKDGLANLRLAGTITHESALRMAVRSDWPELRSILDKALTRLPAQEKQALIQKWLPLRQDARTPPWAVFVLTGLFLATLALSVLFHLSSRSLTRGIAEKTRELQAEFTRRESVEKALRQRDLHLRNVLINADAVVFQIAPDGTIAHIEGKALARIGLSAREMTGRPVADLFGDNPTVMNGLTRVLAGEQTRYLAEISGKHASIMASPVFDENGALAGVSGVATDVTSLVLARKRLAESEERLALILDATNDGFYDWNPAANTAFLSPRWLETFGLPPGKVPDVLDAWRSRLHPKDRQRILATLEEGLSRDDIIEAQYRVVDPSGRDRWIQSRGRVVARDASGRAVRLVGTVTDITGHKESELRYQALFHAATDAIMILEQDRIVDCNPATTALLGYSREELVGRCPGDFSPHRQPGGVPSPELAARILTRSANGDQVFDWVHRRKDGQPVDVEVSLTALPSSDGDLSLVLARDVTQRNKMREVMIRTEKMASLGSLAAGMAHEINNPLAIILQSAQGIQRRLDPGMASNAEAAKRHDIDLARVLDYMRERHILLYLDGIREAGERAAGIVRGMLGFSRVRESAREMADVNALVDKGLALAASEFDPKTGYDFKHITIVKRLTPAMPPVHCAPDQIVQVVLNLLRNAAQALTEAAIPMPCITLRTFVRNDLMTIEVEDNGPGIPPAVLPHIFEPFFTTRKSGTGTGLGLSVSSFIVTENHGGSLTVSSRTDVGTVFTLALPPHPPGARTPPPAATP
ncbi:transporter substrate-binding domain-containing protein [Desulfolutivibrio sulfoxidireducens]|nr:transporter substrate-binding domain-containing protein [Desulfolutivibrio sulfoxidireducens]